MYIWVNVIAWVFMCAKACQGGCGLRCSVPKVLTALCSVAIDCSGRCPSIFLSEALPVYFPPPGWGHPDSLSIFAWRPARPRSGHGRSQLDALPYYVAASGLDGVPGVAVFAMLQFISYSVPMALSAEVSPGRPGQHRSKQSRPCRLRCSEKNFVFAPCRSLVSSLHAQLHMFGSPHACSAYYSP